jgi:NitT/TauT family transport system substrate-binding protein
MSSLVRSFKALAAASALLLAAFHAPLMAQPLTKVTFRLDWKAGGSHAPFYLGKERGYYAAEGIDLTIVSGSGSSDAVKQLGAGAIDMALIDGLVLVQAAEQKVPVKAVAGYYQRTPISLISPKAKPITDMKQLTSGAKIGSKRASSTSQGLTALLAVNKIDPKAVNVVDIGFGVAPLLVGQVDALMGFTMNEAIEAEKGGMPVTELLVADHGVVAYGLTVSSSDKFIAANPALVRGFVRATRKAVMEAAAQPQAAVASMAKSVSEVDAERELKVFQKTVPFWSVNGKDLATFGALSAANWQQTIATAQRVGLVESVPTVKDVYAEGMDK